MKLGTNEFLGSLNTNLRLKLYNLKWRTEMIKDDDCRQTDLTERLIT